MPRPKFNIEEAEEIRKAFAQKRMTITQLAKLHFCSRSSIYAIINNKTYVKETPVKRKLFNCETLVYAGVAIGLVVCLSLVMFL